MRRLGILVALVFAASLISALPMGAAQCPTPVKHHKMTKRSKAKMSKVKMRRCPVKRHKAAKRGAGPRILQPIVKCPAPGAPVVNVPQQPAPVVNVPQQPAPVVNVAAPPPTTAVTVDSSMIYVIRDNELLIIDKNGLCLRHKVALDQLTTVMPTPASASSPSTSE